MIHWNEDEKVPVKSGLDVLVRLYNLLKVAKFFEPNNESFRERFKLLQSAVNEALSQYGRLFIQVSSNAIFVNRSRIKFDYSSYGVYKYFIAEFIKTGIGQIAFDPGLPEDELSRFTVFLTRRDEKAVRTYQETLADFEKLNLKFVEIAEVSEEDEGLEGESEKGAARSYFLGIAHLKEIFEKEVASLNFNVTKRWIQSIFNHICRDESFLFGLTSIKNYDEYTLNHSVNVCVLAIALGRRMGLTRPELVELGMSAFLHDMGKLDVPKEILEKPARLQPEERAVMEKHVHFGAERLIEIKVERGIPNRAVEVAMEHHITADNRGYPRFQRKRRSSLYSKMVKVADFFDAVTTARIYRPKAYTREEALTLMAGENRAEFDPVILKTFLTMMGTYPVGALVALDSGEIGIVFESNPHAAFGLRPKVKIIAGADGRKFDGPYLDLTEVDPQTRKFRRTILTSLDPETYGIRISDYFMARLV